jgi:hypothetical protein
MPIPDLALTTAQIRYDLKIGRAWLAIFDSPQGTAVLEYHAPQGIRGDGSFRSERPRLVLRLAGAPPRILADMDLTDEDRATLDRDLGAVLARGDELAGDEKPLFDLLLRLVRDHHLASRKGAAKVGDTVTSTGVATLDAWASCLTLGDFQAAILAALRPERKAA